MVEEQRFTQNSDAEMPPSELHPSSPAELGCFVDRLKIILKGRSARSLARASGVSETVFRKYASGKSEPTRPALIAMATAAGVSVGWLAAGEGEMRGSAPQPASDKASQPARPDADLLRAAAEVMERALDQTHATADASGRAELLVAIYDMLQSGLVLEAAGRAVTGMLRAAARSTGVPRKQG